jgi:hypothetical protein
MAKHQIKFRENPSSHSVIIKRIQTVDDITGLGGGGELDREDNERWNHHSMSRLWAFAHLAITSVRN